MEALIQNVFTHLFRNSMDHGLEMPDQRLQIGKTPKGRITIDESISGSDFMIAYSDDGGGLNLNALARKVKNPQATDEQIAETIFQSGVSTAEQVTQISGRGIGMDAVRTYLTEVGGNISIAFLQTKNSNGRRSFKFLVLRLV